LIYIELDDASCLRQIGKRRIQQSERATTDTQEMFEQITKYFVEPQNDGGFNITVCARRRPVIDACSIITASSV